MKIQALIASLGLAFALGAQASGDHHDAKHGGVVAETKAFDAEFVAKATTLQLHLRGHDGKALDVSKSSAKLTLLTGKPPAPLRWLPAPRPWRW